MIEEITDCLCSRKGKQFLVIYLEGAARVDKDYNCKDIKQVYIPAHIHTDVVLKMSDRCYFLSLLFFQSFHSWLGLQSETADLNRRFG